MQNWLFIYRHVHVKCYNSYWYLPKDNIKTILESVSDVHYTLPLKGLTVLCVSWKHTSSLVLPSLHIVF